MLKRSFLFNILIIGALFFGILFAFFTSLKTITKHGEDANLPPVIGHSLKTAMGELDGFDIEVDSIYIPYKDPLEVIFQEPAAGNMVKRGRTVFLTVNKIMPPSIPMPDLVNMSFRNAVLTLKSLRLEMGDTIFKPDIAAGAVLQVLSKGQALKAGATVPIGSRIDLVVGAGLSDSTMNVPNLIGVNYASTRSILDGMGVIYNVVWEGGISDSNGAIVYKQFPEAKNELDFDNVIAPGDMIDVFIMQRPSAELLRMNQPGVGRLIDPNDTDVKITYGPPTTELPYTTEGVDANGNPVTSTTTSTVVPVIKPRIRKPKPKSTEEEVKDILGTKKDIPNNDPLDPSNNNTVPELPQKKAPVTKPAENASIKKEDVKGKPSNITAPSKSNTKNNTTPKEDKKTVTNKTEVKKEVKKDIKKDAPVKNINKNSAENDYN
jgi:eukaryotic-like serine/threonine-protein kinase